jgi:hypothetical protein
MRLAYFAALINSEVVRQLIDDMARSKCYTKQDFDAWNALVSQLTEGLIQSDNAACSFLHQNLSPTTHEYHIVVNNQPTGKPHTDLVSAELVAYQITQTEGSPAVHINEVIRCTDGSFSQSRTVLTY